MMLKLEQIVIERAMLCSITFDATVRMNVMLDANAKDRARKSSWTMGALDGSF